METIVALFQLLLHPCALKPSLVEWKHEYEGNQIVRLGFLETFLGGMETRPPPLSSCQPSSPLKPSLVEWKHKLR